MALCWPNVLLLIYAFSIHANAANTVLLPEITTFIPSCARECFIGFLDTNYAVGPCGSQPTLDCLCKTKGKSDFTVGEGAIQCVLSQISLSACDANTRRNSVILRAYSMCDGQENALPNTHATLTATAIPPTPTTSTSSRLTSSSNFSATITASRTIPSSTITSTLTSISSTITVPSPTSTDVESSPEQSSASPTPAPMLTREQVIGITVGSVAGGVLGVLALLIFVCCRRRKAKKADRDSDMLPFQLDPALGNGFKVPTEKNPKGPSGSKNGAAGKTPPRVPPRLDTSSPNMFSRRSIHPEMIGVAISPENKASSQGIGGPERRKSKLLPEKPVLNLKVPQFPVNPRNLNDSYNNNGNGLSFSQAAPGNRKQSIISRQSTATQFEEDFDDNAADDTWGRGSSDKIIQQGTGIWQPVMKVNPAPNPAAPAFFVTGGDGNHWRPGQATSGTDANSNANVAPEYYVRPLNLTRGPVGSFSQPRRPEEYPSRALNYGQRDQYQQPPQQQRLPQQQPQPRQQRPQLQLAVPKQERPTTTSSSIYDGRDSLPASENGRQSQNRPTSFSGARTRRSYRATGPYDSLQSAGSLTSFETNDSFLASPHEVEPSLKMGGSQNQNQNQNQNSTSKPILAVKTDVDNRRRTLPLDLSPVVESPPSGRSPVSYPKIPKRGRLSEETIRMVPPPAQPDFMAVFSSGRIVNKGSSPVTVTKSPIGASPISATPKDGNGNGNLKPWRVAEIQAQRQREQEQASMDVGMSSAMAQQQQQVQSQQPPQRMQSLRAGTGQIWPDRPSASSQPRLQVLQQQPQQQRRQEKQYIAPSARYNYVPPPRAYTRPQGQQQYQPYQPPQGQQRSDIPPQRNEQAPPVNPLTSNPSLTFTRTSSQASFHSFHSQTSTSSSLLAKRRGEQKALALNLTGNNAIPNHTNNGGGNAGGKWRVLGSEEIKNAKSEGWRPMTGSNEREREGYAFGYSEGELPKTPGWVPKLTPTRRGDELFLSVQ